MAEIKVKEKLKEKVDRMRRKMKRKKVFGRVAIEGVSRPKKPQHSKEAKTEYRAPKKIKRQTAMGPRGGQYQTSSSGKKIYARKSEEMTKALIQEVITETGFENFIKSFKMNRDK